MSITEEPITSTKMEKEDVTVKIQIKDMENTLAQTYCNDLKIDLLRKDLASKFKIDPHHLVIKQGDVIISDDKLLSDLNVNEFHSMIIEIDLMLTDEAEEQGYKLDTNVYYSNFTLPDIITVHCSVDETGETKDLVVEIENKSIVKPFLGGYVNKKTKIEYHDAFTQTGPAVDRIKFSGLCTRDTQTVELRSNQDGTNSDRSTQHFGDASELLYLQTTSDYTIDSSSIDENEEKARQTAYLDKILLIQRNYRRYRLEKSIAMFAAEYRRLQSIQKKRQDKIRENYINSCSLRESFPKTKQDFDMLTSQIQGWKEGELKRICTDFTGPSKIVELSAVLDKEVTLLNGIEKRRLEIRKETECERNDKLLQSLSEPVKWIGYKNSLVEMDTLRTQRARFLTELYKKLRSTIELDDRVKLINEVSQILAKETSNKVYELEELFEREKKLLNCKLNDESLEILRERELVVLIDIIKSDKDGYKKEKVQNKVCDKCKNVFPAPEFPLHTRKSNADVCKKCTKLKPAPVDQSIYRSILRSIRREERRLGALSSCAFIIQEKDIQHIIENIWHGHSILSQCEVIADLRLPRWKVSEDWSPWNCLCLTDTESRIHINIIHLDLVYSSEVINDIHSKQSLARSSFKQLKDVDHTFVESGDWAEAGMKDKII